MFVLKNRLFYRFFVLNFVFECCVNFVICLILCTPVIMITFYFACECILRTNKEEHTGYCINLLSITVF